MGIGVWNSRFAILAPGQYEPEGGGATTPSRLHDMHWVHRKLEVQTLEGKIVVFRDNEETRTSTNPALPKSMAVAKRGWGKIAHSAAFVAVSTKLMASSPSTNRVYIAEPSPDHIPSSETGQAAESAPWVNFEDILSVTRMHDPQKPLYLKIIHSGSLRTRLLKTGGNDGSAFSAEFVKQATDEHIILCRLPMHQPVASLFGFSISDLLRVDHVAEHTPAAESGLKVGDVLLSVNNIRVKDVGHLEKVLVDLKSASPGGHPEDEDMRETKFVVKIRRHGDAKASALESTGFDRVRVELLPAQKNDKAAEGSTAAVDPQSTIDQATKLASQFGVIFDARCTPATARIHKIVVGSVGAKAGLVVGDVIEQINSNDVIDSSLQIDQFLADAGSATTVQIRRPFTVVLHTTTAPMPGGMLLQVDSVLRLSQHLERYAGIQCHDVFIRKVGGGTPDSTSL